MIDSLDVVKTDGFEHVLDCEWIWSPPISCIVIEFIFWVIGHRWSVQFDEIDLGV